MSILVVADGREGAGLIHQRSSDESQPGAAAGLEPARRTVTRGGRRIELTTREYALLEYLVRNAGRVLTRAMIAEHVWGLDFGSESNVIDGYVGFLRRKIDASGDRRLLHTVRGAGYVLKGAE